MLVTGLTRQRAALVHLTALARAHRDVPAHAGLDIGPFVSALVAGISPGFDRLVVRARSERACTTGLRGVAGGNLDVLAHDALRSV